MGGSEIVLILLAALLLFGSKRIPEIARGLGKGLQEFKKAADEIKAEISKETSGIVNDVKSQTGDILSEVTKTTNGIKDNIGLTTADLMNEVNTVASEVNTTKPNNSFNQNTVSTENESPEKQ